MELKYPVYARWIGSGDGEFVVRFDDRLHGTVVEDPNGVWGVGHKDVWINVETCRDWKILKDPFVKQELTYQQAKALYTADAEKLKDWLADNHPDIVREFLSKEISQ